MPAPRTSATLLGLRFRCLVFLASFLLFEIELIMGRLLLPSFGSSAQVWMTCLTFYQGALFAGYLWGERAVRWISQGRYRWAHLGLVLLPAVVFPFRLHTLTLPPILSVSVALLLSVGLPFLALSTTSVVAQAWFSRSAHPGADNPWFLYGVSNLGALLALLCYPLLIEPALPLSAQLWIWYGAYAVFVLLIASVVPQGGAPASPAQGPADPGGSGRSGHGAESTGAQRLGWLLLPVGANALLMAGTHAITLDASVPLLWVVPLAVYLLTLIIAFARRTPSARVINGLCGVTLVLAAAALVGVREKVSLQLAYVVLHSAVLFVGCLLVHWHLVRSRPAEVRELGRFYLAMSLGGWLGALAVGFAVPLLFRHVALAYLDYAVAGVLLLAAFLARDAGRIRAFLRQKPVPAAIAGLSMVFVALLAVTAVTVPKARGSEASHHLEGSRTFYGLYNIKDEGGLRWFHHGNTVHGVESLDPAEAGVPRAYFGTNSPIAGVLAGLRARQKVAVIGLGAGSLAGWSRPGEQWDFYELDPEVERLARAHFHFLERARAEVRVVIGDARLTLAGAPDGQYDVLIVDAFSSDFVPTHLITREAIELYERKLKPGGLLVCHISNRIFDLAPVLTRLGTALGLRTADRFSAMPGSEQLAAGYFESHWFALTRDEPTLAWLKDELGWQERTSDAALQQRRPWTDDYVNLFHALRSP